MPLRPYTGVYRDSGVSAYEAGPDFIRIEFMAGGTYVYTYKSAGKDHIENMKALAASGKGLNSYINDYTKDAFEWKED